jgi:hypothetical protein
MVEAYSPDRGTAIHEAGHAVAAYLLGRPFTSVTVVSDAAASGRVAHRAPGAWFDPEVKMDGRTRLFIHDHVVATLAGPETEAAWFRRVAHPPADWEASVVWSSAPDSELAIELAGMLCRSRFEEVSFLAWCREQVLNWTGRPIEAHEQGDKRYWRLVNTLADVLLARGTLTWRSARQILVDADDGWPKLGVPRRDRDGPNHIDSGRPAIC